MGAFEEALRKFKADFPRYQKAVGAFLEDFFEGFEGKGGDCEHVLFEGDCEAEELGGVSGRKDEAVWWGWNDGDGRFCGRGRL